jgi:hypothetical protein
MIESKVSTRLDESGDLTISFPTSFSGKLAPLIVASKKDNVLHVPASRFKILPLDSISDVVLDGGTPINAYAGRASRTHNPHKYLEVLVSTSFGRFYRLCGLPPNEAVSTRRALIRYLFGGQSRPVLFLTDKVKVLKFSTSVAYFELDHSRSIGSIMFYLLTIMATVLLIPGIFFPGALQAAGVLALVFGPLAFLAGFVHIRDKVIRTRIHVSMDTRTLTIEQCNTRQERVTSSKTFPIDDVKGITLRKWVRHVKESTDTITEFGAYLELENGKHVPLLIGLDSILSARRFSLLLAVLVVKIKKNIRESEENADNVLNYDSISRHNEEWFVDLADEVVDTYFSESKKQLQAERENYLHWTTGGTSIDFFDTVQGT